MTCLARRLEQELQEARRRHEAQLAEELLRQQSRAQCELEQVRCEADELLTRQRSEYEQRLQSLEQQLQEQHGRMQQSDEHRLAAADVIERLQLQKTQLEREVLCNRRARELEAKLKEQVRVACFVLRQCSCNLPDVMQFCFVSCLFVFFFFCIIIAQKAELLS